MPLTSWFCVLGVLGLSSGGVTIPEAFVPGNGKPLEYVTYVRLLYPLEHPTFLE